MRKKAAGAQRQRLSADGFNSFHVEGNSSVLEQDCRCSNFNPLLPCGRRRSDRSLIMSCRLFQSTPSMRKETIIVIFLTSLNRISIHSLHAEGDTHFYINIIFMKIFQSTPSMRKETELMLIWFRQSKDFNPLPPCGRRRPSLIESHIQMHFNPLPPCGRRQS